MARPDLSDVRIVDAGEKELPFLIDQSITTARNRPYARKIHAESFLSKRGCLSQPAQIWPYAGITLESRLERTSSSPCGWKDQTIKKTGERSALAILFLGWATARQTARPFPEGMPVPARRR